MNAYTDPKLLDVQGALDTLPTLSLDATPSPQASTLRATGTDVTIPPEGKSFVTLSVTPARVQKGHFESLGVTFGEERETGPNSQSPKKSTGNSGKSVIETTRRLLNFSWLEFGDGRRG